MSHSLLESGYGNNWGMYYGGQDQAFPRRYFKIGNVRTLSLNISSDFIASNSYQGKIFNTPDCAGVVINDIDFNLEMNCFSYDNLARSLYGKKTNVSQNGTVEEQIIHGEGSIESDAFFAFNHLGPVDGSVILRKVTDTGSVVFTFTEDTDYKVSGDGITILEPFIIDPGDLLQLSYEYQDDSTVIEAIQEDIGPRSLLFRGVNYADNGYDYNLEIFKTKMKPVNSLDFVSQQDFGSLQIEGKILKDFSKDANALSQYMTIKKFVR